MFPITTSTEIECPATEVFAYATDPTRFNEWQKGVFGGHIDPPRSRSAGQPGTSWGLRGIDGPIPATVDVSVEPLTESRSRLTISVDFEGHGIGKVLVPFLVRREAQKEMPADLALLKQRLETTGNRFKAVIHRSRSKARNVDQLCGRGLERS